MNLAKYLSENNEPAEGEFPEIEELFDKYFNTAKYKALDRRYRKFAQEKESLETRFADDFMDDITDTFEIFMSAGGELNTDTLAWVSEMVGQIVDDPNVDKYIRDELTDNLKRKWK